MKRWVLAMAALVAVVSETRAACPSLPGDVNGDGLKDVNDVMCVLLADGVAWDYLMAVPLTCLGAEPSLVDANCDQSVDGADVNIITELVLGEGLDPTWDLNTNQCIDACEPACNCGFNEECGPDGLCYIAVDGCGPNSGLQAGSPWPTHGYCGGRRFQSPLVGPELPSLWWTYDAGADSQLEYVAIAADSTIYITDSTGSVHAISREGAPKWRTPVVDTPLSATPAIGGLTSPLIGEDGRVLVGVFDGLGGTCEICAVGPTGALKWCVEDAGCIAHLTPTPLGHVMSAKFWPASVTKLTPTGTKQWEIPTTHSMLGIAPVLTASGTVISYAASPDESWDGIWANATKSGSIQWAHSRRIDWGTQLGTAPDGTVYGFRSRSAQFGGGPPILFAMSPNGVMLWSVTLPSYGRHAPVAASDGTLRIAQTNGALLALDSNGDMRWSRSLTGPSEPGVTCKTALGQPITDATDTTYVVARTACAAKVDGAVHAVSSSGDLLWSVPLLGATERTTIAVTAESALLVLDHDHHRLHALR